MHCSGPISKETVCDLVHIILWQPSTQQTPPCWELQDQENPTLLHSPELYTSQLGFIDSMHWSFLSVFVTTETRKSLSILYVQCINHNSPYFCKNTFNLRIYNVPYYFLLIHFSLILLHQPWQKKKPSLPLPSPQNKWSFSCQYS